jgi:predicted transcriptional regulator
MREKVISRLLTDDYAERILVATYFSAKSAQEISEKFDVPIAACYRKIHELEDAGLITCQRIVTTPKGKSMKLYRSQLRKACIMYEEGIFKVRLEFKHEEPINNTWIQLNTP